MQLAGDRGQEGVNATVMNEPCVPLSDSNSIRSDSRGFSVSRNCSNMRRYIISSFMVLAKYMFSEVSMGATFTVRDTHHFLSESLEVHTDLFRKWN